MQKKHLLFFYFLLSSFFSVFAQLSSKHYIPPITTSDPIANQIIYISTPSSANISFTITPIGGTPTNYVASNDSPFAYEIYNSSNGGNNSQLHQLNSDTNTITNDKGFIIESTEGLLSVSVRVRRALVAGFGQVHAGALVSKGLSALGKEFRVGGFIPEVSGGNRLNFVSVMATENNTNITFNIPSGTNLLNGSTTTGPVSINLDEKQTYIMAVGGNSSNREKLIGILVSSDKDIVVNSGSANSSFGDRGDNSDYGFDQIVGADKIDNEYIFVRAEGEDIIENILVIANEDNTDVFINDSASPEINLANAGDWVVIEGDGINNNGNGYSTNGNMYIQTSKPVFAYQGIGGLDDTGFPSQANQGMFFVPPLSCENSGEVDNIPNINRMQPGTNIGDNFTGGITIVTNKSAAIEVFENNNPITINTSNGPFSVEGNPNYETYRFDNLNGNIKVTSNKELYCAYFNYNGFSTSGGFYSGFPSPPEINLDVGIGAIGFCIPDLILQSVNTSFFDGGVEWFYDDGTGAGYVTTGNTTGTLSPTLPGNYILRGTLACTGRTFDSQIIPVSVCPDDLDNDNIIDNIDIDLDNDGILNCDESKGDTSIDFSAPSSPVLTFQDGSIDASFISATTSSSNITGESNSNFTSTISAGSGVTEEVYTLGFDKVSNIKITQNPTSTHTTTTGETFIFSVGPSTKNITVIDPDNILLIDTDFDDVFETGVNNFSASEIRFKYNPTPSGTSPYKLVANNIDQITFKHQLNGTVNSTFEGNLILTCFGIDSDDDGINDAFDADSDNDGIPDIIEAQGIPVTLSGTDADSDGLDDVFTTPINPEDSDLDLVPDYLDLDSDNDGVYDLWEAGHSLEDVILTDGQIDNVSVGVNGLDDRLETAADSFILNYTVSDLDSDSIYNYLDVDSDGDGCRDVIEAGFTDLDNDNIIDGLSPITFDEQGRVNGTSDGFTRPNSDYSTGAPILINTPFVDVAFCETSTSTITIDSTADTFQWEVSTDGGTNWTDIIDDTTYNGATTKDLEISNLQLTLDTNLYRVFLQRTGNSCDDTSNEITLTVDPLPIANTGVEIDYCIVTGDPNPTVDLTQAEDQISSTIGASFQYFTDPAGTDLILDPVSHIPVGNVLQSVYVKVISDQGCARDLVELVLNIGETPNNSFDDLVAIECDDFLDPDGNDTPGMNDDTDNITNFSLDLTAILTAINPPINTEVFFYESTSDRYSNSNNIPDLTNYRNNPTNIDISIEPDGIRFPIYYKILSTINNDCEGIGQFYLQINQVPLNSSNTLPPIVECDNAIWDGDFTNGSNDRIDLTQIIGTSPGQIFEGTGQDVAEFDFSFFTSEAGAFSGDITSTDYINTPNQFTNSVPTGFVIGDVVTQTIYVRIKNINTQCINPHTSFDVIINPAPITTTPILPVEVCDIGAQDGDTGNGYAQNIDISGTDFYVLDGRPAADFTITYHKNLIDLADLTSDGVDKTDYDSDPTRVTIDPVTKISEEELYIRIIDISSPSRCVFDQSTVTIIVYPEPTTEIIPNQLYCDDDSDGEDTNGIVQNINLDGLIPDILGPLQPIGDFSVTFHADPLDLPDGTNALTTPHENISSPNQQRIYVRVENKDTGCINDDLFFDVIVNPLPKFKVTSPQIVCLSGPPLTLFIENPDAVYDYVWNAPNGDEFPGVEEITITSGGLYTVTATTTNGTGCTRTREIQVNESIVATITEADVTIVDDSDNNSITIDPTNLGIGDYQYALINENGVQTAFQDIPVFESLSGGFYTIVVQDKNGCRPDANLIVSVIEYPKFFTPNNDGINDTWAIKGANSTFYPSAQINIFNRFGKIVAQIDVDNPGWDGTYGGKRLPSDDYWFSIMLVDRNGNARERKGNFSLLRR